MSSPGADTRERLIAAASELFAERGFHGTKMRDIAGRAGVNLAAANYHFGSKETLYLDVLRAQFGRMAAQLEQRGVTLTPARMAAASRPRLQRMLADRVAAMLELMVATPPNLHAKLMQREMADPTAALPVVVEQFVAPQMQVMEALISRLAPELDGEQVARCVLSIVGQVIFYFSHRPAVQILAGGGYGPAWSHELARHIAEFSLGGMLRLNAQRPKRGATGRRASARAGSASTIER